MRGIAAVLAQTQVLSVAQAAAKTVEESSLQETADKIQIMLFLLRWIRAVDGFSESGDIHRAVVFFCNYLNVRWVVSPAEAEQASVDDGSLKLFHICRSDGSCFCAGYKSPKLELVRSW